MSTAKYIHQIWWQGVGCIPKKYEKNRASWVENHPEWYYRLWDETSLTQLLKNHYSTFLPLLKRLTHMIQRVHLCKYILLYHFGGIAVDLDVLCNINLEPVLKDARLVLASRYEHVGRDQMLLQAISQLRLKDGQFFSTSFMASCERNPFWLEVLKEVLVQSFIPREFEPIECYIHRSTGSTLLTEVFRKTKPKGCIVLDKKQFDPTWLLCTTKLVTLMDISSGKNRYRDSPMVNQHDHSWSKNKKIFPILIFAVFLILAAVIIKVTILKKSKPMSRSEKNTLRVTEVM